MIRCSFIIAAVAAAMLSAADPIATLTARTGAVYVILEDDAGKERSRSEARPGAVFNGGEKLATAKGAKASLSFIDGTVVDVAENSELMITPTDEWSDKNKNTIALLFGYLVAKVQKITGDDSVKFQVTTPSAIASVRGTVFGVGVGDDGSSLIGVEEGVVDVLGDVGGKNTVSLAQNEGVETGLAGGPMQKKREFMLKNFEYGKWNDQLKEAFAKNPEMAMKAIDKRFETAMKMMVLNEEGTKQVLKKMHEVAQAREHAERANNRELVRKLSESEEKLFDALFMQKMQEKALTGAFISYRGIYMKIFEGAKGSPEMMQKIGPAMRSMREIDMKVHERKQEMKRIVEGDRDFMQARMKANNIDPMRVRGRMEQKMREAQEKGAVDRERLERERRERMEREKDAPKPPDRKPPR
ncbi:MAG: FecR family protein [Spirochaetota bacterium]